MQLDPKWPLALEPNLSLIYAILICGITIAYWIVSWIASLIDHWITYSIAFSGCAMAFYLVWGAGG